MCDDYIMGARVMHNPSTQLNLMNIPLLSIPYVILNMISVIRLMRCLNSSDWSEHTPSIPYMVCIDWNVLTSTQSNRQHWNQVIFDSFVNFIISLCQHMRLLETTDYVMCLRIKIVLILLYRISFWHADVILYLHPSLLSSSKHFFAQNMFVFRAFNLPYINPWAWLQWIYAQPSNT